MDAAYTGENNWHAAEVAFDATFGAALVTLERSLQAGTLSVERLYYHQSTINQGTALQHHPFLPQQMVTTLFTRNH